MCVAIAPSGSTTVYAPAIKQACAVCIAPLMIDGGRTGTFSDDESGTLVVAVFSLLSTACILFCAFLASGDPGGTISTFTAPCQF